MDQVRHSASLELPSYPSFFKGFTSPTLSAPAGSYQLATTVVLTDHQKYKSLQRLSIPLWRLLYWDHLENLHHRFQEKLSLEEKQIGGNTISISDCCQPKNWPFRRKVEIA
jgi:hypothetical protein